MSSVKIILRTSKTNSEGEAPLCIRIIKDRKAQFIFLGHRIHPDFWNEGNMEVKSSHPNAMYLNKFLTAKKLEAQGVAIDLETTDKYTTPDKIKEQITGRSSESFFKYADRYLEELEFNQKIGTYSKHKGVISKMKEYTGGKDLLFHHISIAWLKNYEHYLKVKKGNGINTVHSNHRTIRRIINAAIREELIGEDKNPYRKFQLSLQKVSKEFLTEEELMLIQLAPLEKNSMKDHHRNMYVFSAYAGGLRISDILLLKWKNFDGERILMETKKTGTTVSIKLPGTALDILKQYQKHDSKPADFIFPVLKNDVEYSKKQLYKAISSGTAYTNTDLRDIAKIIGLDKHISFHSARHTFATRALMKGMRIEYVSKLMGHSKIEQTLEYAKIVNEELDKAMEVFN